MSILKRKKAYFSISAVAKMFSVHQQTLRLYEKEGLIAPKRSPGGTRLFSEEDVDRLEEIIYLTHKLGVNLAGVEMVLKLKKQMNKMQKEMNKIFDATHKELDQEIEQSKEHVSANAKQLMKIKQKSAIDTVVVPDQVSTTPVCPQESQNNIFNVDDWEIEYED